MKNNFVKNITYMNGNTVMWVRARMCFSLTPILIPYCILLILTCLVEAWELAVNLWCSAASQCMLTFISHDLFIWFPAPQTRRPREQVTYLPSLSIVRIRSFWLKKCSYVWNIFWYKYRPFWYIDLFITFRNSAQYGTISASFFLFFTRPVERGWFSVLLYVEA
jgi:hypothetical protein